MRDMAASEKRKRQIKEARARLKEIKKTVTVDGKTFRKSFYGETLDLAYRAYLQFINPPLQTEVNEPPPGSFGWILKNKWAPLKSHQRRNTRLNLQHASRHILAELAYERIEDVDATRLVQALDAIAAKETCRNPNAKPKVKRIDGELVKVEPVFIYKPLSASLINRCRLVALDVNELASELYPDKVRRINPKRVPKREEDTKTVEVYSPQEMRRLLEASRGTIAHVPVLLYGFLGEALNEALGHDCRDLTAEGVLELTHQAERDGERTVKLKSKYRRRSFPLPDGLLEELQPFTFSGGRLVKNGLGQPLKMDAVDRALFAAQSRAGLRRLTCHELRHSFSSWMDENGCPESVRLRLMGQSAKKVKDRYNHPTSEALKLWLTRFWMASFDPEPKRPSTEPVVNVYDTGAVSKAI